NKERNKKIEREDASTITEEFQTKVDLTIVDKEHVTIEETKKEIKEENTFIDKEEAVEMPSNPNIDFVAPCDSISFIKKEEEIAITNTISVDSCTVLEAHNDHPCEEASAQVDGGAILQLEEI